MNAKTRKLSSLVTQLWAIIETQRSSNASLRQRPECCLAMVSVEPIMGFEMGFACKITNLTNMYNFVVPIAQVFSLAFRFSISNTTTVALTPSLWNEAIRVKLLIPLPIARYWHWKFRFHRGLYHLDSFQTTMTIPLSKLLVGLLKDLKAWEVYKCHSNPIFYFTITRMHKLY